MDHQPQVSVLVPAYNEEVLIERVISQVQLSFTRHPQTSYEVIVCDNNSTDRTAPLAKAKGARVVFESHNQISRARNTAAKAALGPWLIFLDADTYLTPELLGETLGCFRSGKIAGGGSVLKFDRKSIGFVAAALTWLWNRISVTFNLAAGSYLFCYQQAWSDVGGFNEELYASEEIFFSRKIKRWARARRMKFQVLSKAPILTSARKMEWYGPWELLTRMLPLVHPLAVRSRDKCGLWYVRPDAAKILGGDRERD